MVLFVPFTENKLDDIKYFIFLTNYLFVSTSYMKEYIIYSKNTMTDFVS